MYQPQVRNNNNNNNNNQSQSPFTHNAPNTFNSGLTTRMKMELASALYPNQQNNNDNNMNMNMNNSNDNNMNNNSNNRTKMTRRGANNNNNNKDQSVQPWQQGQKSRLTSRSMPPEGPPPMSDLGKRSSVDDLGKRGVRAYSPNSLKMRRKMRKNNREKQRRMELNEKFDKLCSLLNLGKQTKTEKYTILTEAINLIIALKEENAELRRERHNLRGRLDGLTSSLQDVFPPQPEGFDSPSKLNISSNNIEHTVDHNLEVKMFDFGNVQYSNTGTQNIPDDSPFRTGHNPFNSHPNSGISPSKFGLLASSFSKRSPSPFGFPPNAKSPGNPFQNMRSPQQLNQTLMTQLNALSPPQVTGSFVDNDVVMDTDDFSMM